MDSQSEDLLKITQGKKFKFIKRTSVKCTLEAKNELFPRPIIAMCTVLACLSFCILVLHSFVAFELLPLIKLADGSLLVMGMFPTSTTFYLKLFFLFSVLIMKIGCCVPSPSLSKGRA